MINGFSVPTTYLALFLIPSGLVLVSLLVRYFIEDSGHGRKPSRKRTPRQETEYSLLWVIPAILLGLVAWYFLRPVFADNVTKIYFYGILITLGVVAAAFLGQAEAKRRGFDPEFIWDALIWVVGAGIIGARIWHIFTPPPDMMVLDTTTGQLVNPYFAGGYPHILEMLNIRNGGLGIPGAVIAGGLALWFYCRSKKISFLTWADMVVPGVALAQAIGRWGNFFNQELYGLPTNLPWKIKIDNPLPGYEAYDYFHPVFLYESLWNLLNMAILLWAARRFEKWLKPGDLFLFYVVFYGVGRFGLEFLRLNSSQVAGINFNQYFMLGVGIVSAVLIFLNHRLSRKTG